MSGEQEAEVLAAALKRSAVMVTDGVHSAGPLHPWHEPAALLGELRAAGWQLTRVGDEERLRAVVDAARVVADEMVQQGGGDRWWEAIAALTKAIDFLAPQPPSPASQGEER